MLPTHSNKLWFAPILLLAAASSLAPACGEPFQSQGGGGAATGGTAGTGGSGGAGGAATGGGGGAASGPSCAGTARACDTYNAQLACSDQDGCFFLFGACLGAGSCPSYESTEACEEHGCTWQKPCQSILCSSSTGQSTCAFQSVCVWEAGSSACVDDGTSGCTDKSTGSDCVQAGCTWDDSIVGCRGTATSCETLGVETCGDQDGCSLEE